MSFTEKNHFFILAHGEETPADPEWDEYVAALGRSSQAGAAMRVLVVSRGGGPNMLQRKKMKVAIGPRPVPTAVITSSQIARAIVTIIRLTQPVIAAFSPTQRKEAYAHLGFTEADHAWLDQQVSVVEGQVGAKA